MLVALLATTTTALSPPLVCESAQALAEGESQTYSRNGRDYDVSLLSAIGRIAKFRINGEEFSLPTFSTYTLANGVPVSLDGIHTTRAPPADFPEPKTYATFCFNHGIKEIITPITRPALLENELLIPFGEMKKYKDLTIEFTDVVEDSRCPMNARCIWEGRVMVALDIFSSDPDPANAVLALGESLEIGGYTLTLVEVMPYPSTKTTPDEYVVRLRFAEEVPSTTCPIGCTCGEGTITCPTERCEDHTYSTCPRGCQAECTPSVCSEPDENGNVICTADCDGRGSCVTPIKNPFSCSQHTFSTCPSTCTRVCLPPEGCEPGDICPTVCAEIPGSCVGLEDVAEIIQQTKPPIGIIPRTNMPYPCEEGIRKNVNGRPTYCIDGEQEEQKEDNAACQNNFECKSNFCSKGQCYDIAGEVEETRGLLQQLFDWLNTIF